jgi:hypothetical protein
VTVDRRILYRASSMQVLGGVLNGQLGLLTKLRSGSRIRSGRPASASAPQLGRPAIPLAEKGGRS